jgi:hypothetical protein
MSRFEKVKQEAKSSAAKVTKPLPLSIVVAGNIGEYESGQTLTKLGDIADYFRQGASVDNDKFNMTDDAIIAVVKSIPYKKTAGETEGSSDWEVEIDEALQSRNRSNAPEVHEDLSRTIAATASEATDALSHGAAMDKHPAFCTAQENAAIAGVLVKRASVENLLALLVANGYEFRPSGGAETITLAAYTGELDKLPNPNSFPVDKDGNIDKKWRSKPSTRNDYARYYVSTADGQELFDWYQQFVAGTKAGAADLAELREFKLAKNTKTQNGSGRYKGQSNNWLDGKINTYQTRFNGRVAAVKKAMVCYFMMQDVVESFEGRIGVGFMPLTPKDRSCVEVTDATMPIRIWNVEGGGYAEVYSVTGFNNLDIQKALDNGGTFSALVESTAKGPNEAKKRTLWEMNQERFLDNHVFLAEFFNSSNVAWMQGKANERVKGAGRTEEAKQVILDLCAIYENLGPFYRLFGGDTRQKIQAERNEADKEVAAELGTVQKTGTNA